MTALEAVAAVGAADVDSTGAGAVGF